MMTQAQSQQIVEAPSSQASATGSMMFNQNQQQRSNFGMGNQQRESQSNAMGGQQPQ